MQESNENFPRGLKIGVSLNFLKIKQNQHESRPTAAPTFFIWNKTLYKITCFQKIKKQTKTKSQKKKNYVAFSR
jgi:hypothetical protein